VDDKEAIEAVATVISNKALLGIYTSIFGAMLTVFTLFIKSWFGTNREELKKLSGHTEVLATKFSNFEISIVKEYATKSQLEKIADEIKECSTKNQVEKIRDEGIEANTKVHERVDGIAEKVARVETIQSMCPSKNH